MVELPRMAGTTASHAAKTTISIKLAPTLKCFSRGETLDAHLLFPLIHRLLVFLLILLKDHIDNIQIFYMSVSFEILSNLQSDH